MNRICALLGILAGLAFAGCSGRTVNEEDPAEAFKTAEEDIEDDRYLQALEVLQMIRHKFPYSKYSVLSQLRIADVYFLQENYSQAAEAYVSFYELHPKHEKVTYAMFRAGESYFQDIPSSTARDLVPAQKSLTAFNTLLKRYPSDPSSEEARKRVAEARKILAEKEHYIARFYENWDQPESARRRYNNVTRLYPDTEYADEAKKRSAEITAENPKPDPSKYGPPDELPGAEVLHLDDEKDFKNDE